ALAGRPGRPPRRCGGGDAGRPLGRAVRRDRGDGLGRALPCGDRAMAGLAAEVLARARAAGLRIATAESCTGGMVAAALTDVAGSSDVFDRGFVTYSNAAKEAMLGVSAATLAAHGAVSEEVAREMAEGALSHSLAGLAVSITGIAGPGGSEFKPEGR